MDDLREDQVSVEIVGGDKKPLSDQLSTNKKELTVDEFLPLIGEFGNVQRLIVVACCMVMLVETYPVTTNNMLPFPSLLLFLQPSPHYFSLIISILRHILHILRGLQELLFVSK